MVPESRLSILHKYLQDETVFLICQMKSFLESASFQEWLDYDQLCLKKIIKRLDKNKVFHTVILYSIYSKMANKFI